MTARRRKDYATKPSLCPRCGYGLDRCFNTQRERAPKPGDITVCMSCALVMTFTEDMSERALTVDEIQALPGEMKTELLRVALAIALVVPRDLSKRMPNA